MGIGIIFFSAGIILLFPLEILIQVSPFLSFLSLLHLSKFSGCDGAPMLPLLYIMINLAFNISVLNVVKISSAVVSSITVMLSGILSLSLIVCCVHLHPRLHTHIYGRVTKSIVFYNLFANGCFVIFAVPISIYILSLQLSYLPEATSLSPFFLLGSLILVSGLVIYSIPQPAKHDSRDG